MMKKLSITSSLITGDSVIMKTVSMKAGLIPVLLIASAVSLFSEIEPHPLLETWLELDREETRYSSYRDSEEILNLKLHQMDYINNSRRRYGVQPLQLDILAGRVANRMAQEACIDGFTGHWNLRGEKPYHRYAFAGGTDHIVENAAAYWSSAPLPDSLEDMQTFMRESHDRFMAERAPNDGHKENCINPDHNYVGLGVCLQGRHFRYYEEFIDRYLVFDLPPGPVAAGGEYRFRFKGINEGLYPYALIAYYEPFPVPMTVAQVERKGSYPDFTNQTAANLWPWDLMSMDEEGWTEAVLTPTRDGLYYVHIYLNDTPYTGGSSANTRGKLQASGLVIQVPSP